MGIKEAEKDEIKIEILARLAEYGVEWDVYSEKLIVNDLKLTQKQLAQNTNLRGLKYKDKFKNFFAKPEEIDILRVNPYLKIVENQEQKQLWAYATSFWSIPVTNGYGRRIRFLVFDEQNDKLIGIFGLGDPVIGLKTRDEYIGWTKDQKLQRLYNCMTAYVLGAVPPYNLVLGSKLIALCLMFPEIRKAFYDKYRDKVSLISGQNKQAHLVHIDTLGAFGKSAIYTRLINWQFLGYTKGQSHLHITANESWELIKQVIPQDFFNTYQFGQSSNWKMKVLKEGLRELGFSPEMLNIGWRRGYYSCPLAENWRQYLLSETAIPQWRDFNKNELIKYWQNKWLIPRLEKLANSLKEFGKK